MSSSSTKSVSNESTSNAAIAAELDAIAAHLERQHDNPFRSGAYRNAAEFVRDCEASLAALIEQRGTRGLQRLPSIGPSIAKAIVEFVRQGHSRRLEQLELQRKKLDFLATLPTVGPKLSARIQSELHTSSLDEILLAAQTGRLRSVPGIGRKRSQAIRESLEKHLDRAPSIPRLHNSSLHRTKEPPVADLLELDKRYRQQADAGRLLMVAPRQFNPTHAAWMPVWNTQLRGSSYGVHFANSAQCHELDETDDWVIIRREGKRMFGLWTVVTARFGALRGQRVIRGRERECRAFYNQKPVIQRELPTMDDDA